MSEPESTISRRCLICAVPVTAARFGLDCCRACAMFFKRSVLSGKKFVCRAGDRLCFKDGKFKCRRCRFDRCVAVGLVYEGPLRLYVKATELLEIRSSSSGSASDVTDPSTSRGPESILQRIGREFNASVERRRVQDVHILKQCDNHRLVPHPTEVRKRIYFANLKTTKLTYNVALTETIVFFRQAFPSLAKLSQAEQDLLFKSYLMKFSFIEGHHRTQTLFGELKRYVMSSVIICLDLDCVDEWVGDEGNGLSREAMMDSLREYMRGQFAIILPVLNKAKITDKELYALLAFILSDIDASTDFSDHVLSTVDDVKKEALEDLQRYYKEEMELSDYSTRLGNLMSLVHSIRECTSLFQEFFRMQTTLFDVYRSEEMIKDLLL